MNQPIQESACRYYNRLPTQQAPVHQFHTGNLPVTYEKLNYLTLPKMKIRDPFQLAPHLMPVKHPIGLSARGLYRGASTPVQHPELNPRLIDDPTHQPAKSVEFTNQMPFCNPSNCRIAGHLRDKIKVERNDGCLRPQPASGVRCFAPGVPRANYNDIKLFVKGPHNWLGLNYLPMQNLANI
jgi:hypothetical protein